MNEMSQPMMKRESDPKGFNLWEVFGAVGDSAPERECLVWGDRRLTYAAVADRAQRLGSFLYQQGLGLRVERPHLAGYESGQAHLGILLHNCTEYVESMLGAYAARVAPFNINYRYSGDELTHLLIDANAEALVFHSSFAGVVAEVIQRVPSVQLLIQVADHSRNPLVPGAVDFEEALRVANEGPAPVRPSPDDLYVLYTGGTTGYPKGVLWRQHDIFLAAMGGRSMQSGEAVESLEQVAERAGRRSSFPVLMIAPLMHGAAQWAAFMTLAGGGTVVFPADNTRIEPSDIWRTVELEGIKSFTVVGDAMARPLIDELERGRYDTSALIAVGNGGAPLSLNCRRRIGEILPEVLLTDSVGASETGAQMSTRAKAGGLRTVPTVAGPLSFTPSPFTTVVNEAMNSEVSPNDDELGWLAQRGNVPLGYLGDAEKSLRTFPVVDGIRYAIPGDRARWLPDGRIELLGRDAATINSGGEKIFAEEVEQAVLRHPAVADVVVVGAPSKAWGQEVVALVQLKSGTIASASDVIEESSRTLARYKLPKRVLFVPLVARSPSGKADYQWARNELQMDDAHRPLDRAEGSLTRRKEL
jgi:acyl-CoA synthetase (AMP-forming)/AMP-acid ligase II